MSRRQLRRLQGLVQQPEEDDGQSPNGSGDEGDIRPSTSAWAALADGQKKKKKKPKPRNARGDAEEFHTVQKEDPREEEKNDEEEEEERIATKSHRNRAVKGKGKGGADKGHDGPKAAKPNQRRTKVKTVEEEEDLDAILQTFAAKSASQSSSAPSGDKRPSTPYQPLLELLQCDAEFLNPDNELRRLFGRAAQGHTKGLKLANTSGHRGHKPSLHRKTVLVKASDEWPPHSSHGLSVVLVETNAIGVVQYAYRYNAEYSSIENAFVFVAARHDPQGLAMLSHRYPYHLRTLYELSVVAQLTGNMQQAKEFLQRALYAMEVAAMSAGFPWLTPATKLRCLPWIHPENEVVFQIIEKWCHVLCKAGHYRTATEFTKLLFSLDPETDPCACLLTIDFYAIRATQWHFLNDFRVALDRLSEGLARLPGLMYFSALGLYLQEVASAGGGADAYRGDASHTASCSLLDSCIQLHPIALVKLLTQLDDSYTAAWLDHPHFATPCPSELFVKFYDIFVSRGTELWKRVDVQDWLQSGVGRTLRAISDGSLSLSELTGTRLNLFEMPVFQKYAKVTVNDILGRVDTLPAEVDAVDDGDADAGVDVGMLGIGDAQEWLEDEEALLADLGDDDAVLRAVLESEGNVWVPDEQEDDIFFDD